MMPINPTQEMEEACDAYASKYDTLDDEWQDMGTDQYYYAGYLDGRKATIQEAQARVLREHIDEVLASNGGRALGDLCTIHNVVEHPIEHAERLEEGARNE